MMQGKKRLATLVGVGLLLGFVSIPFAAVNHSAPMQWDEIESGTAEDLNDIWGTGPDNVYA